MTSSSRIWPACQTQQASPNMSLFQTPWSNLPSLSVSSAAAAVPHFNPPQPLHQIQVPDPHHTAQNQYQWHSGLSPHHYEIVTLPNNVQKCYDCGSAFALKYRSAPYNLVIKHVDKRVTGKNAAGHLVYSGDYTNTYYHPSNSHIKRKNPIFTDWSSIHCS